MLEDVIERELNAAQQTSDCYGLYRTAAELAGVFPDITVSPESEDTKTNFINLTRLYNSILLHVYANYAEVISRKNAWESHTDYARRLYNGE